MQIYTSETILGQNLEFYVFIELHHFNIIVTFVIYLKHLNMFCKLFSPVSTRR